MLSRDEKWRIIEDLVYNVLKRDIYFFSMFKPYLKIVAIIRGYKLPSYMPPIRR